jgi:hypothetical protein
LTWGTIPQVNESAFSLFWIRCILPIRLRPGDGELQHGAERAVGYIYCPGTTLGGPTGTKINGSLHPTARAAIYAGAAGSTESQLVFVGPATGFASGATAGYITIGSVTIPFIPQGAPAVVQIRAWDALSSTAATYESALATAGAYVGKSQLYSIASLGGPGDPIGGSSPATPATIPNQVGFGIEPAGGFGECVVPEPSQVAFALIFIVTALLLHKERSTAARKN